MHQRKSNISYLFKISEIPKSPWYFSIIGSILGILFEAVPFVAVYFIVKTVLSSENGVTDGNRSSLMFWGGSALVALIFSVVCTLAGGYGAHKATYRLIYGVRKKVLSHLGTLPMGYFSSTSTGEIQKQMESGMGKIETLLAHAIPNLIGAAPLFFSILISLFLLNAWLGLALLVPIIAAFAIQALAFSGKKARQLAIDASRKQGTMNRRFNEFLRGITVIKIYGQSQKSTGGLEESVVNYRDFLLAFTKRVSLPYSIFKVLMLSMLSFVLPAATLLILMQGAQLRLVLTILMFLIVTPCLFSPILELMQLGANLRDGAVAVDQIEALLNTEPLEEPKLPQSPKEYTIRFENVSFSYQSADDPMRQWAVRNVSFSAVPGTITALVGPSGGGKSTVGQLLCRFWDVTEGSISIGGIDIRKMRMQELMDSIAFVFQDTFLFSGSVYENIAMNRPASPGEIRQAAKAAMCEEFIHRLPQGYETKLGDGGFHLSGGEAQRIAIARAILKDSPIVVLDEATAFTDADNEALIQQALNRLLVGKTVIMIAHRLSTIQNSDQILVLQDGALVQQGLHHQLLDGDGLYHKLWELQNETEQWTLRVSGKGDREE